MRTFLSMILLFILVPATLLVLLATSFKLNVLTPQFIEGELSERQLYTIAQNQISVQLNTITIDPSLPILGSDIDKFFKRVITTEWMKKSVESLLNNTFAWFNGPTNMPLSLPIDLRSPKREFVPAFDALLEEKIPLLPKCGSTRNEGMCRTPGLTAVKFKAELKSQGIDVATIAEQLPESIDLANPVLPALPLENAKATHERQAAVDEQVQSALVHLNKAKVYYALALRYYGFALLVYVFLILCYIALNSNNWHRFVSCFGVLALVTGVVPLVVGAVSKTVIEHILIPQLQFDQNFPQELAALIPTLIDDVRNALFVPLLIAGIALFIAGITAIVAARFIQQNAKKTI